MPVLAFYRGHASRVPYAVRRELEKRRRAESVERHRRALEQDSRKQASRSGRCRSSSTTRSSRPPSSSPSPEQRRHRSSGKSAGVGAAPAPSTKQRSEGCKLQAQQGSLKQQRPISQSAAPDAKQAQAVLTADGHPAGNGLAVPRPEQQPILQQASASQPPHNIHKPEPVGLPASVSAHVGRPPGGPQYPQLNADVVDMDVDSDREQEAAPVTRAPFAQGAGQQQDSATVATSAPPPVNASLAAHAAGLLAPPVAHSTPAATADGGGAVQQSGDAHAASSLQVSGSGATGHTATPATVPDAGAKAATAATQASAEQLPSDAGEPYIHLPEEVTPAPAPTQARPASEQHASDLSKPAPTSALLKSGRNLPMSESKLPTTQSDVAQAPFVLPALHGVQQGLLSALSPAPGTIPATVEDVEATAGRKQARPLSRGQPAFSPNPAVKLAPSGRPKQGIQIVLASKQVQVRHLG